jgi:hypothetical protein
MAAGVVCVYIEKWPRFFMMISLAILLRSSERTRELMTTRVTHKTKHLLSGTMCGFPPTKLVDRLCSSHTHSTSSLATPARDTTPLIMRDGGKNAHDDDDDINERKTTATMTKPF